MTSAEASPTESNHLDDIIIIWLDETLTNPEKLLLSQRKTLLLSYIKSIQSFVNCLECQDYIKKMKDVRIFFVVSGSLGEKIVPSIHDLPQLTFIYIFCADKNKHEIWTKQFNKIRGVFIDDVCLSTELKKDVCSLSSVNLPFGLFDSPQQTLQDLTREQASFMWFQLIIEVLLRLPQTSEAKAEMITECRDNYEQNEAQLEKITIFEKTYRANDAIRWYTDNTFVFQLFNKAFRKQDFEIIFKYRYFLVDLFNQLSTLYNQQYKDRDGSLTVYRGQMMFQEELMKLKQSINHLISINTFLSASVSSAVAADFSGNGEHQSMGIVSVIFEITVDLTVHCRPFANIDQLSFIKDEREILFSIGTIFRIESVDLETDTIWLVKLSWTNDTNKKLKEMKHLTNLLDFYTSQHIGELSSILTFGLFLSKMGLLSEAQRFYIYLKKVLPSDHSDRGVLHNNLGEVLCKLNNFDQAHQEFEQALVYFVDIISIFHPLWAIIHSNIAKVALTCQRPKKALEFFRCAMLIFSKLSDGDDWRFRYIQENLAIIYNGMGSAHYCLYQFEKALQFYQKALQIELDVLPHGHPTLVDSYSNLGHVNAVLKRSADALKNYESALKIAKQNLLDSDSRLVTLHCEMAMLIHGINQDSNKILFHCSQAEQLMRQSTVSITSYGRKEAYKTIAFLYKRHGLRAPALQMWKQFIKAAVDCLLAESNTAVVPDLTRQIDALILPKESSEQDPEYMPFSSCEYLFTPPLSRRAVEIHYEIADALRSMEHSGEAICYYERLLKNLPPSSDPRYDKQDKSRLHNNIATCYQDLNDDQMALHHYQLALDTLAPDEEHKSMQAAIMHYNIALIYINCNKFNEAQMHLDKSLLHFSGSSKNMTSVLDVQIYDAFAKIYERCNEWQMARDYYQRIIDKIRQNAPDHPVIAKYEKRLQYSIDKINENRSD